MQFGICQTLMVIVVATRHPSKELLLLAALKSLGRP
jgi:hypothetical protein